MIAYLSEMFSGVIIGMIFVWAIFRNPPNELGWTGAGFLFLGTLLGGAIGFLNMCVRNLPK